MFKNKFIHRNKFCQLLDQWQILVPNVLYYMLALIILKIVNYINMMFMWLCISFNCQPLAVHWCSFVFVFVFFNHISFFSKWISYDFRSTEAHTRSLQILLSIRNTASTLYMPLCRRDENINKL